MGMLSWNSFRPCRQVQELVMSDDYKPRKISVGRAISIGLLWVNGPIFPIMLGIPALTFFVLHPTPGEASSFGSIAKVVIAVVSIPAGFVLAWLWWSLTVPKWRLWAYERVDDIAALKERAVAVGLTWSDGSVFEQTEIKSNEHAEREQQIEREKGGQPAAPQVAASDEPAKSTWAMLLFSAAGWASVLLLAHDVDRWIVSSRLLAAAIAAIACFIAANRRLGATEVVSAGALPPEATARGTRGFVRTAAVLAIAVCAWTYWPEVQIIGGKRAADAYRLKEALEFYSDAIASNRLPPSRLATAYSGRGDARYDYTTSYGIDDRELGLALQDYTKARQIDPKLIDPIYGQGFAYQALGWYPEAMAAFEEAYKLDQPKPYWSLIRLSEPQRIIANYDGALKYLDQALKIAGAHAGMPIHYHRGRVFFSSGRFREAVDAFTLGIPFQKDYSWAFTFRACALAKIGEFDKAVADADAGITLHTQQASEAYAKTPEYLYERKQLSSERGIIERMAKAKNTTDAQGDTLCIRFWDEGDDRRTRSPLLR